jgi:hypothetical protein
MRALDKLKLPYLYYLSFLAASLLSCNSRASFAFTITPRPGATNTYIETVRDTVWNDRVGKYQDYITTLEKIAPAMRGGTPKFLEQLNNETEFDGWIFQPVPDTNLSGTLRVINYFACAGDAKTSCSGAGSSIGIPANYPRIIGNLIQISYQPGPNDPPFKEPHWIQRVARRTPANPPPQIDVPEGSSTPYYDDYFAATGGISFKDRPFIDYPIDGQYQYIFHLYIVDEVAPRTVKIYNGIRWADRSEFGV